MRVLRLLVLLAALLGVMVPASAFAADSSQLFTIYLGDEAPGWFVIVGLECKADVGAAWVSTNGINLKRDATVTDRGETLELWSGFVPTGTGWQTLSTDRGCTDGSITVWRDQHINSFKKARTGSSDVAVGVDEGDSVIALVSGVARPPVVELPAVGFFSASSEYPFQEIRWTRPQTALWNISAANPEFHVALPPGVHKPLIVAVYK